MSISIQKIKSELTPWNTENQIKLKNNEKLINDIQEEINNVKKQNFEKFEKITELENSLKLNEIKLNQANDTINKYTTENNNLIKTNGKSSKWK